MRESDAGKKAKFTTNFGAAERQPQFRGGGGGGAREKNKLVRLGGRCAPSSQSTHQRAARCLSSLLILHPPSLQPTKPSGGSARARIRSAVPRRPLPVWLFVARHASCCLLFCPRRWIPLAAPSLTVWPGSGEPPVAEIRLVYRDYKTLQNRGIVPKTYTPRWLLPANAVVERDWTGAVFKQLFLGFEAGETVDLTDE
jgi:hypothetical protein